jgi:hypothetical protein
MSADNLTAKTSTTVRHANGAASHNAAPVGGA